MKTHETKGMSETPTVPDKICLSLKGLLFPTLLIFRANIAMRTGH